MTALTAVSTVHSTDGTVIGYRSLGGGVPMIVVGGAMRAGVDYLAMADVLAERFSVHVMDRRGRGASGPLGPDYGMEKECQDLLAVQGATGARLVFGHSYGGLVVLETAVRAQSFDGIAVYEPGVSVNGSIPTAWIDRYRQLLERGDSRGAFACFVRAFGHPLMAKLPIWYLRRVLRLAIRQRRWKERYEPLLGANLAEHEQVAELDSSLDRYQAITAKVLLLGGSHSPSPLAARPLGMLHQTIESAELEIIPGLDHLAPDEKAPEVVARRVLAFMGSLTR